MRGSLHTLLDLLARFTGGQGSTDVTPFALAAFLWSGLLALAIARDREGRRPGARLLVWGLVGALTRELFMIAVGALRFFHAVDAPTLHAIVPPLQHAWHDAALVTIAAGLLAHLTNDARWAGRYLGAALASVGGCYLATAGWWAGFIRAHPAAHFGQTWADAAWHLNGSVWLLVALVARVWRGRGWARQAGGAALGLFFLSTALKLPDLATGEAHENAFTPLRYLLYLAGGVALGYTFVREQVEARRNAVRALEEQIRERRRAEAVLAESEARFRSAFQNAPAGMALTGTDGRFLRVNRALVAMLGYTEEELGGKPFQEATHDEDIAACVALIQEALAGARTSFDIEKRYLHRDGRVVWAFVRTTLVRDAANRPAYFITHFQDTTERRRLDERLRGLLAETERARSALLSLLEDQKRAETAVRASEERLRIVLDGLGPQMFVGLTDANGVLLMANRPALEIAALRSGDALGKPLQETYWLAYSEAARRRTQAAIACAAQGQSVRYDEQIRVGDGQLIWIDFSLHPLREESGRIAFLVPSAIDITERKRAEAALRASEQRFRVYIDRAADALFVHDFSGRFIDVNRQACVSLGYSREELLRLSAFDLEQDFDLGRAQAAWRQMVPGHPLTLLGHHRRKDGSTFPVEVQFGCFEVQGERQYMGLVRDITERQQGEAALRASHEQLRALAVRLQTIREEQSTLIAREIHDVLAQELTQLKIDLVWLGRRLAAPVTESMRATLIARVADATAQADTAIGAVQRIATELRPVILDSLGLFAAVEWQAEDFARRTGLVCRAQVPATGTPPDRDRATALFRILQESLTNVARHAQATEVAVSLVAEPGAFVLVVRDNGAGITPAQIADAHSIGLAGMKERALAFGGTVTFEGGPGTGTVVTVRLPFEASA